MVHKGDPAPLFYYSYLGTVWCEGQGLLHLKVSGQGPRFSCWGSSRPSASWKSWMQREWQGVLVSQGTPPPAGPPGVRGRSAKSSHHPHPRYSGEQGRWASRAVGHTVCVPPRCPVPWTPPPAQPCPGTLALAYRELWPCWTGSPIGWIGPQRNCPLLGGNRRQWSALSCSLWAVESSSCLMGGWAGGGV